MKKLIIIFTFLGSFTTLSQDKNAILKVHTFSEVEVLHQKNPKPIVVYVYTDWCKICYGMKKTTFKNDEIIQLLNEKFYFITLNGEEKKDITFLGKTFVYKPTGTKIGVHELAKELAIKKGQINYPTTTILSSKFEINEQIIGYLKSEKLLKILIGNKNISN